mmetsp:Transcript_15940/g.31838  ORF Transcript_15940/g.31838 Transcript_15940/m.31838 type:complete len:201 (+) Transcript_15940:121-723(+)
MRPLLTLRTILDVSENTVHCSSTTFTDFGNRLLCMEQQIFKPNHQPRKISVQILFVPNTPKIQYCIIVDECFVRWARKGVASIMFSCKPNNNIDCLVPRSFAFVFFIRDQVRTQMPMSEASRIWMTTKTRHPCDWVLNHYNGQYISLRHLLTRDHPPKLCFVMETPCNWVVLAPRNLKSHSSRDEPTIFWLLLSSSIDAI